MVDPFSPALLHLRFGDLEEGKWEGQHWALFLTSFSPSRHGGCLTLLVGVFRGDSEVKGFMLEDGDTSSTVGSREDVKFAAAAGVPSCISAFLGPPTTNHAPSCSISSCLWQQGVVWILEAAATAHPLPTGGISIWKTKERLKAKILNPLRFKVPEILKTNTLCDWCLEIKMKNYRWPNPSEWYSTLVLKMQTAPRWTLYFFILSIEHF